MVGCAEHSLRAGVCGPACLLWMGNKRVLQLIITGLTCSCLLPCTRAHTCTSLASDS